MSGSPGSSDDLVGVERAGAVAVVTLRRTAKLNALSFALEAALVGALDTAEVRTSGCVVITGGPEVFSAGADVTELGQLTPEDVMAYYRGSGSIYERLAGLDQPSVSAINGYCLGGGFELALATDFRIAGATARFGFPEVGIGIVPSSGGLLRLVRMVGTGRARELVLARQRLDAAEALGFGLLTEVTDPGSVLERSLELAERLAGQPALASLLARRAIDAAGESSREATLLIEQLAYAALAQTGEVSGRAATPKG